MKNVFLNIMAAITVLCMITMTVFVIMTAGALKENSEKSLARISDIEEELSDLTTHIKTNEAEEASDSSPVSYDTVNPEDIEDLADATTALAEAVAALQEQSNNMASVDYATLNEAIERLNTTSESLEETAGRISAIFG